MLLTLHQHARREDEHSDVAAGCARSITNALTVLTVNIYILQQGDYCTVGSSQVQTKTQNKKREEKPHCEISGQM